MNRYIIETIKAKLKEVFFNVSILFRNDPNWDYNHEDHEDEIFITLQSRRISTVEELSGIHIIDYSFILTGVFTLTDVEEGLESVDILDRLIEALHQIKFNRYKVGSTNTDERIVSINSDSRIMFKIEYAFNLALDTECVERISELEDIEDTTITGIQLRVNNTLE